MTNPPAQAAALPPQFDAAVAAIESVFGARDRSAAPKLVKQLRARLEALLGHREQWTTALLRPLFDELLKRARGRRRSADHERLWLSLAGWCLRPGYGDPLDGWRIDELWPLFEQGVQHGHDSQVSAEWWTLWRRVAGGLDESRQLRLLQDFAFNLRGSEAGLTERPPRLVKGGWDDMLRVGASLERIAAEHKVEIGEWLVERVRRPKGGDPHAHRRAGRCGQSAASAPVCRCTAARTPWCRSPPSPSGSRRCSHSTGSGSTVPPPRHPTSRA